MNSFFDTTKTASVGIIAVSTAFGLIQPFQQPERVVGFFNAYRQIYPATRSTLRDIAN